MPVLILQEDIKEGMELALPAKNKFGQVLLPAGAIVENKHKRIFKIWGISTIYVKEDNIEIKNFEYNQNTVNEAANILGKRLTWKPKNFNEEDLYNMALQHLLEKNF